jgi:hypothetical protein
MAVPAAGLPAQDAADFATLMRFAVTSGQTPGFGNGELPPGYAPMTKKDGLADQVNYTLRAASAVESQHGTVPPLTSDVEASLSAPPVSSPVVAPPVTSAPTAPTLSPVTAPTVGAAAPVPPVVPTVPVTTPTTEASAPATKPASQPLVSPQSSATSSPAAVFTGTTVASTSALAGSALPSVLAIGLGGLFIASGLRFRIGRKR